uniref:Peroxin-13 n=1 Tax=Spongospora subterranea TaxID=70186 RepID=A0A0H5R547_9EUKA|eukprot:CRZ03254.1 hypothetical protein [Spongospora subterranea]
MALVSPPKPWERLPTDPTISTAPLTQTSSFPSVNPGIFGSTSPYSQPSYGLSPSYQSSSWGMSNSGAYGSSYPMSQYQHYSQQSPYMARSYNGAMMTHPMDQYKGTPINTLVTSGHTFMSGVQQQVSSFGRFSQILHMNLDALHGSFSSFLQLLTNISLLKNEFSSFFGTFGSLRSVYVIYIKLKSVLLRLLGRQNEATKHEFDVLWKETCQGQWGWLPTFLTLSLAVLLAKKYFQMMLSDTHDMNNTEKTLPAGLPPNAPWMNPSTPACSPSFGTSAPFDFDPSNSPSFMTNQGNWTQSSFGSAPNAFQSTW